MITDHLDAPPELMPLRQCDCCGVPSSYLRRSIWHGRSSICAACFIIWYDPNKADPTDPASVKAERLERFGTVDVGHDRWRMAA
jgi:hypothetical protein